MKKIFPLVITIWVTGYFSGCIHGEWPDEYNDSAHKYRSVDLLPYDSILFTRIQSNQKSIEVFFLLSPENSGEQFSLSDLDGREMTLDFIPHQVGFVQSYKMQWTKKEIQHKKEIWEGAYGNPSQIIFIPEETIPWNEDLILAIIKKRPDFTSEILDAVFLANGDCIIEKNIQNGLKSLVTLGHWQVEKYPGSEKDSILNKLEDSANQGFQRIIKNNRFQDTNSLMDWEIKK